VDIFTHVLAEALVCIVDQVIVHHITVIAGEVHHLS
jgi:hypothetical protein